MFKVLTCALLITQIGLAQACETGHWITENLADGQILKLEDGSVWKIGSFDAIDTQLWLVTTDIVVCDGKLINVDDGEEVEATQIK